MSLCYFHLHMGFKWFANHCLHLLFDEVKQTKKIHRKKEFLHILSDCICRYIYSTTCFAYWSGTLVIALAATRKVKSFFCNIFIIIIWCLLRREYFTPPKTTNTPSQSVLHNSGQTTADTDSCWGKPRLYHFPQVIIAECLPACFDNVTSRGWWTQQS